MAGERDGSGAGLAVSGADHGAHTAASGVAAGGQLADQAAADFATFEQDLALFGEQTVKPVAKRAPGRPLGSTNRATSRVREYLTARGYRDPMEMQAALVAADPRELAAAIAGCAVKDVDFGMAVEILKLQQKAADALMPYWHQQQPKAVEVKVEGARPLFMLGGMVPQKGEADQRLKDVTPRASQIEATADEAQPVGNTDIFDVRDDD